MLGATTTYNQGAVNFWLWCDDYGQHEYSLWLNYYNASGDEWVEAGYIGSSSGSVEVALEDLPNNGAAPQQWQVIQRTDGETVDSYEFTTTYPNLAGVVSPGLQNRISIAVSYPAEQPTAYTVRLLLDGDEASSAQLSEDCTATLAATLPYGSELPLVLQVLDGEAYEHETISLGNHIIPEPNRTIPCNNDPDYGWLEQVPLWGTPVAGGAAISWSGSCPVAVYVDAYYFGLASAQPYTVLVTKESNVNISAYAVPGGELVQPLPAMVEELTDGNELLFTVGGATRPYSVSLGPTTTTVETYQVVPQTITDNGGTIKISGDYTGPTSGQVTGTLAYASPATTLTVDGTAYTTTGSRLVAPNGVVVDVEVRPTSSFSKELVLATIEQQVLCDFTGRGTHSITVWDVLTSDTLAISSAYCPSLDVACTPSLSVVLSTSDGVRHALATVSAATTGTDASLVTQYDVYSNYDPNTQRCAASIIYDLPLLANITLPQTQDLIIADVTVPDLLVQVVPKDVNGFCNRVVQVATASLVGAAETTAGALHMGPVVQSGASLVFDLFYSAAANDTYAGVQDITYSATKLPDSAAEGVLLSGVTVRPSSINIYPSCSVDVYSAFGAGTYTVYITCTLGSVSVSSQADVSIPALSGTITLSKVLV